MPVIHVNGRDYELATVDQLTLDEAIVVYEYTKISLDEIQDLEGFHPGLVAALIHVSVARGEPGQSYRTVRQTVGRLKLADLESVFMDISEEAPDELPPPGLNGGSGAASSTPTAPAPDATPPPSIGSRGSDTGATSDPPTSAR